MLLIEESFPQAPIHVDNQSPQASRVAKRRLENLLEPICVDDKPPRKLERGSSSINVEEEVLDLTQEVHCVDDRTRLKARESRKRKFARLEVPHAVVTRREKLARLTDMGFLASAGRETLQSVGWDVAAAVDRLVEKDEF